MPSLTCNSPSLVHLDPGWKTNKLETPNANRTQPSMDAVKPAVYDDAMQCETAAENAGETTQVILLFLSSSSSVYEYIGSLGLRRPRVLSLGLIRVRADSYRSLYDSRLLTLLGAPGSGPEP